MNLFQLGKFKLHSGQESNFKIDCDALSEDDIVALAHEIYERFPSSFSKVIGIPRGGLRLANALHNYRTEDASVTLLVDDVYTTGTSMKEWVNKLSNEKHTNFVLGLVLFDRSIEGCPNWIYSVFKMKQPNKLRALNLGND